MGRELQSIAMLVVAVTLVGGCAKENVVRKDEPAVKSATIAGADSGKTLISSQNVRVDSAVSADAGRVDSPAASLASGRLQEENAALANSLSAIFFDYDSYTLSAEARSSLVAVAEALKQQRSVKLKIEGNCDERGSDEYNLALGEKRSKVAAGYLTTLGIDEARLVTISYGKEKPALTGHDEASWAKNRRDDFVVLK